MRGKIALVVFAAFLLIPSVSAATMITQTFEGLTLGTTAPGWTPSSATFTASNEQAYAGTQSGKLASTLGGFAKNTTPTSICGETFTTWLKITALPVGTHLAIFFNNAGDTVLFPIVYKFFANGSVAAFDDTPQGNVFVGSYPLNTWFQAAFTAGCGSTATLYLVLSTGLSASHSATDGLGAPTASYDSNSKKVTLAFSAAGTSTVYFDDMGSDVIIPETPTVNEPTEFDSGLIAFITGLGFVTPESQFFFSLILVGITLVSGGVGLKFMAPGRLKFGLVAGLTVLVGVFCVVLSMFELWMFVLAIVLAGTILKGSGEVRNTFRELRQSFARGAQDLEQSANSIEPAAAAPAASAPEPEGEES